MFVAFDFHIVRQEQARKFVHAERAPFEFVAEFRESEEDDIFYLVEIEVLVYFVVGHVVGALALVLHVENVGHFGDIPGARSDGVEETDENFRLHALAILRAVRVVYQGLFRFVREERLFSCVERVGQQTMQEDVDLAELHAIDFSVLEFDEVPGSDRTLVEVFVFLLDEFVRERELDDRLGLVLGKFRVDADLSFARDFDGNAVAVEDRGCYLVGDCFLDFHITFPFCWFSWLRA